MKCVRRRGWLLLAVSVLLLMTGTQCRAQAAPSYGDKVKFKKGVELKFANFSVTYVGSRKVASPLFSPGFVFEDFTVAKGNEKVTVSWSAGTGDIGPSLFEIGGKGYQIELRHADGVGRLKDNELVIKTRRR